DRSEGLGVPRHAGQRLTVTLTVLVARTDADLTNLRPLHVHRDGRAVVVHRDALAHLEDQRVLLSLLEDRADNSGRNQAARNVSKTPLEIGRAHVRSKFVSSSH